MTAIVAPLPQFFDTNGAPLQAGFVYIGAANANPETSPALVYWDDALTQPAEQPLRTRNGLIARSGNAAQVYVTGDYSMTVKNSAGVQVFYLRSAQAVNNGLAVEALRDDLASTASGKGSALVGYSNAVTYAANTVGAEIRMMGLERVPLLKYIPVSEWAAIQAGTSTYDCAAAFVSARNEVDALPRGGVVVLPMGTLAVSTIDWENTDPGRFYRACDIVGAGKHATRIVPTGAGQVLLFAQGRNHCRFADFTIDSTTFASQCGIFLGRSVASGNCNNNTFFDVWVIGSYTKAGVVSLAAESTRWNTCRFENTNSASKYTTFYTSTRNNEIAVLPGYGSSSIEGPNTDNKMFGCEFYAPFGESSPCEITVFSRAASFAMMGCTIIGFNQGTAANCLGAVYRDPVTGVWNGHVEWHGCHFEIVGTGGCVVHWLDCGGASATFQGISSFGGYYVVGSGSSILDFDRTNRLEQPLLSGSTWTPFHVSSGATGIKFFVHVLRGSSVIFRNSSSAGDASVNIASGFIQQSNVDAVTINGAATRHLGCTITKVVSALPTSGNFTVGDRLLLETPTVGQPLGWNCTVSGTLGTLNGGATTGSINAGASVLTLSSATGAAEGQRITVAGSGGGPYYIRKLVGTTAYLDSNASTTVTGAAVAFSAATLVALANL